MYKNTVDWELEGEIWKDIIGYENYYQISNFGRVRSLERNIVCKNGMFKPIKKRIICQSLDGKGHYLQTLLSRDNIRKQHLTHRLVGMNFLENPLNKPQINHKDGVKTNNMLYNLEWVSKIENGQHRTKILNKGIRENNSMAKFSNLDVIYIYTNPDNLTSVELQKKFNCGNFIITAIWNGHRWQSLTYSLKRNKIRYGVRVDYVA